MNKKLYKLYYQYRHEVEEPPVFVCICRAEQIEKIQEHYSDLWSEIVEKQLGWLDKYTIEELTGDPVVQGWESFEGVILEDIETKERFWYVPIYSDEGEGYELEPVEEGV